MHGGGFSADARGQQTETIAVPGHRGAILDRNGKELAVSEDAATIFATPYQVKDPEEAARRIGRILDLPESQLLESLWSNPTPVSPTWPARSTWPTPSSVRELDLRGIGMLPDSRRVYPQGSWPGR